MTSHTRTARVTRWAGLLLVAAMLPVLGTAAPTAAEPGCTTEEAPEPTFPPAIPPDYGCDDTTPPDTTIVSMAPEPNAAGFTRTPSVTFTFQQVVTDGDQGPWTFRCRLDRGAEQGQWETCTSPKTYDGLTDGAMTFHVHAVDAGDSSITYVGDPFTSADNEDPAALDEDTTPATRTWTQDTKVPGVSLLGGPYDREGTGWPITDSTSVTYLLGTDEEGVTFRCQIDGRALPCSEGDLVVDDLKGGDHIVTAEATDAAGNKNTSLAEKTFTVPHNLTSGRNWKKVDARGAFGGDVLKTRKAGATVSYPAQNVREVRLIAPGGGNLGKIRVRVADGIWHTINLGKGRKTDRRSYFVQAFGLRSGKVVIESLATRKHPVRVDALVFPHG